MPSRRVVLVALRGEANYDLLRGDGGNDVLNGGTGFDTCATGAGEANTTAQCERF